MLFKGNESKTKTWYQKSWPSISNWVTELATHTDLDYIYIENFDVIPEKGIDKKELCNLFNGDNGYWQMSIDKEGELVVRRK